MVRLFITFLLLTNLLIKAQINDDFSDGNHTANFSWEGNTNDWIIENGQLKSNSSIASSYFYISTESTLDSNAQWEFYVNLKFSTSSNNYVDVYLMSDSSNLLSSNNSGYFVRIGNTKDEVSLYKNVNGTSTIIINGVDRRVGSSNNTIKVQVTRDSTSLWTLKSDDSGTGTSYVDEGTVIDSSINSSNYFGIVVKQSTASFHQKHYFDDIIVQEIGTEIPPIVVPSAGDTALFKDVIISEIFADPSPSVGLPEHEFIELYNRSDSTFYLDSWTVTDASGNAAVLESYKFLSHTYLVICKNADTSIFKTYGNVLGVSSLPSLNNTGDVIYLRNNIQCIDTVAYFDSWYAESEKKKGGYTLELMDEDYSLNCPIRVNWKASENIYGGTPGTLNSVYKVDSSPPQLISVSLLSNDSLVLLFDEPLDSTTITNLLVYSINNGVGNPISISIEDLDVKSVMLTFSTVLEPGLEYIITINDFITDCANNTITTNNSISFFIPEEALEGDLIINEILFNPMGEGVDFVEIYNRSDKVIDLQTIQLSNFDSINNLPMNLVDVTDSIFLMGPNTYLVLTTNSQNIQDEYETLNHKGFLKMEKLPSMNNDAGTICLSRDSAIIDVLFYDEKMHYALLNDVEGVSLERIDFDRLASDKSNWHSAASTIGYATPAYENSQYQKTIAINEAITLNPEIFSPDEDGFNDVITFNYHFEDAGYTGSFTIYDSKGREIKKLFRNELLGTNGVVSWDGISETNEKGRIGIYFILIDVFDLSGNVQQFKKGFVLGGKL